MAQTEEQNILHQWLKNTIDHIKSSPKFSEKNLSQISKTLNRDYANLHQQYSGKRPVTNGLVDTIRAHFGLAFEGETQPSVVAEPAVQYGSNNEELYEVVITMRGTKVLDTRTRTIAN